ncbi:facilitated trehalose transporter Tret1-like [Phymastichus coffea]|uniref:facilitated trehalose transporter Tret1-like n=1 Tax=Phymastichus coffea TaxID=108790 RepID=UPI00273AEF89|nr:facilitated trehalose transporter Tret1-like [Phymastichus coffea]
MFAKIRRIFPQALAIVTVWIIPFEIGIVGIWTSPYVAQLTAPNSPIPLNSDEASWVTSILYLGKFTGAILGSICVNFLGSKKSCLITGIPFLIGWIISYFANSALWLCVARVSLGTGYGLAFSCFALYLGEIAPPDIRGALVSFAAMGFPFGNLFGSLTGPRMSIQASSITYFVPSAILIIVLFFLPDSPHHLVKIDDVKGARESLRWYRGGVDDVEHELEGVVKFVELTASTSFMEKLAEFRLRHVRKATFLVMILFAFSQMCGLMNIIFNMETILRNSKSTVVEPSSAVSYVLTISVISSIITMGLYDRFGRKLLFITSSTGVSIALMCLGTHFILVTKGIDWNGAQWLPIASLFFFIASFANGLNAIPSIVSSEVYSANIKFVAALLANITASAASFLTSKLYQPLVDMYGEAYVFYGHALITFLAVPYALIFMPETKGKTLQQIQNDLMR